MVVWSRAQSGQFLPDLAKLRGLDSDLVSRLNSVFLDPGIAQVGSDYLEIHSLTNEVGNISCFLSEQLIVLSLSLSDDLDVSTNREGREDKEGRSDVVIVSIEALKIQSSFSTAMIFIKETYTPLPPSCHTTTTLALAVPSTEVATGQRYREKLQGQLSA